MIELSRFFYGPIAECERTEFYSTVACQSIVCHNTSHYNTAQHITVIQCLLHYPQKLTEHEPAMPMVYGSENEEYPDEEGEFSESVEEDAIRLYECEF